MQGTLSGKRSNCLSNRAIYCPDCAAAPEKSWQRTGYRTAMWLVVLIFGILNARSAGAQTAQQFTGHVLDSTGALIPMAQIVVHNQATGVDVITRTTGQGVYTAPYLKPGMYDITASKDGFTTTKKTDILLQVDQASTIDFALKIGTSSAVVTVNASAAQIELTKADRGEVIDGERIAEMPLDSRNPYALFGLSPGTHDFSNPQYTRPFDGVTDNQYANGSLQQPQLNIDGLPAEAGGDSTAGFKTNAAMVPSIDSVQEFKINLNAYDASYGHSAGSSIDVALKSGGNAFHGVASYYMRRRWLDATPWQTKYTYPVDSASRKPDHKRDQYGFEFDGPVIIPHLYDGRNKLFYMVNYEQMIDIAPNSSYSTYSLPNPAWLTGDFSTATYWSTATQSLRPLNIYDPLTPLVTIVDPLDGKTKQAHSQFPGNRIPIGRLDPVGVKLAQYLTQVYADQPSQIVNPGAGFAPYTNNYTTLQIENDIWRNGTIKLDYAPRPSDQLSARWNWQGRWKHTNSGTGLSPKNDANMNGDGEQPAGHAAGLQWVHTFSPNLLLTAGVALSTQKSRNPQGPTFGNNFVATLGFASAYYNQLQNIHNFPYITASGLPNSSGYPNEGYVVPVNEWLTHSLQTTPNVTFIHGAHTMRAGLEMRFNQWDNPDAVPNNDRFAFSNNFSNQFYNSTDAPNYSSGSAIASMLLGYPNSGTVYSNNHPFYSQHYFAPWVQDDWKLTRRLTLNLGVRWDLLPSRVERFNKLNSIFNPNVLNPVSAQIPSGTTALGAHPGLMGGLEFANVNGQSRGAYAMNKLNIAPRIGFAYAIGSRMSLRGGLGEDFINDFSENPSVEFGSSTSYTNSLDNGLTPYTATTGQGLSNPIPFVLQPTGSSLGYYQSLGSSLSFYNPRYHIPSQWNYSLSFQAALSARDVIEVSYVGNRSTNTAVSDDLNHISPLWNAQCDVERVGYAAGKLSARHLCDDTATGQIANPYLGVAAFKGTSYYSSSTLSGSNFTRPYPLFGSITQNGAYNNGRNWYNSLQVTMSHQVSKSLSLHAAYTHAKALSAGSILDTVNRVVSRQVSTSNDVKHSVTFSGVAYLPFGRNRLFLSNVNRWVNEAINGWQISPLYTYYSGFPWRPGGNWELSGAPMGVAQSVLPRDGSHSFTRLRGATPCVGTRDTDTGAIIPGAAAIAAGCTSIPYVTAPNGYAVTRANIDFGIRQPGAHHLDVALAKNFKIPEASKIYLSEATNLQLRVDFLNALNHPNWDQGYQASPTSIDFGTIQKGPTGPTNLPRYLQLSARLNW